MDGQNPKFLTYLLQTARRQVYDKNYEAAFSHYLMAMRFFRSIAFSLRHEFVCCLSRLTESLKERNDVPNICDALRRAQAACSFSVEYACILTEEALRLNLQAQAVMLARAALEQFPSSVQLEEIWERVACVAVERWHFKMLNDVQRNKAYHEAIVNTIRQHNISSVLDIGSGTGLLSLFALEVDTLQALSSCEVSPVMAEINRKCVSSLINPSLQTTVIECHSTRIAVPEQLHQRVDLLVTEIFDAALFGEQCLDTLSHAWSHLLTNSVEKTGRVIPMGARVKVCAIECAEIRRQTVVHLSSIPLLDMRKTPIFSTTAFADFDPYTTEDLFFTRNGYRVLSPVQELFYINFSEPECYPGGDYSSVYTVEIAAGGQVDALAVWFDLHLTTDVMVSTAPSASCCWEQAIFPLLEMVVTPVGQEEVATFRVPTVATGDQLTMRTYFRHGILFLKLHQVIRSSSIWAVNPPHLQSHASHSEDSCAVPEDDENRVGVKDVSICCHECCVANITCSVHVNSSPRKMYWAPSSLAGSVCQHCVTVQNPQAHCSKDLAVTQANTDKISDSAELSRSKILQCTSGTQTDTSTSFFKDKLGCSQQYGSVTACTTCNGYSKSQVESGPGNKNQVTLDNSENGPHLIPPFVLPCEGVRKLNDLKSHSLYVSALRYARERISCEGRVLDLSCGFPIHGLLSLKLGFQHAVLCCGTTHPGINIMALADSISLHNGLDKHQWVWHDLPAVHNVDNLLTCGQYDVVLTDFVDMKGCIRSGLVDQLPLIRAVGVRDGGLMVPQVVDVHAILIDSPHLLSMTRVTSTNNTLGHDVAQHINHFQTRTCLDLDLESLPHSSLTSHFHVFHLDLQTGLESLSDSSTWSHRQTHLRLPVTKSGVATAVVFYFHLQLAPDVVLSTVDKDAGWRQAAYMLEGEAVSEGQVVDLHAQLHGSFLRFALGAAAGWRQERCGWCGDEPCVCVPL